MTRPRGWKADLVFASYAMAWMAPAATLPLSYLDPYLDEIAEHRRQARLQRTERRRTLRRDRRRAATCAGRPAEAC